MENHVIRQHVAMTWSARSSIGDIGGADVAEESHRRNQKNYEFGSLGLSIQSDIACWVCSWRTATEGQCNKIKAEESSHDVSSPSKAVHIHPLRGAVFVLTDNAVGILKFLRCITPCRNSIKCQQVS